MFTYDDYQSGQAHGPYPAAAATCASRASASSATSWPVTTTPNGGCEDQWEMYDLEGIRSSASTWPTRATGVPPSRSGSTSGCKRKLARVEKTRLQPLS